MTARIRITTFMILALVFGASPAVQAWGTPPNWTPPGERTSQPAWSALFDFDDGRTVRFDLSMTRRGRIQTEGTLHLSYWGSDELQFGYSIGRVSAHGTAPANPQALVGAITLSALSERIDWTALQMLLTPFHFVQWYEAFETARFRNGTVWQEMRNPPARFEASRSRNGVYDGTVYVGRNAALHLAIDLNQPLPLTASVTDGDLTYRASMQASLPPGLLR